MPPPLGPGVSSSRFLLITGTRLPTHIPATRRPTTRAWWPKCWRVATRSRWAMSHTAACGVARAPIGWRCAAHRHCRQLGQPGEPSPPRGGHLSPHHPDGPGDVPYDFLPELGGRVEHVPALRGARPRRFLSHSQGQGTPGGSITGLHTHGRHGPYPPHLPLLATSGG